MPTPTHTARPATGTLDRRIVLHQLYAACVLIIAGAGIGLIGLKMVDAASAATVGTAVIGAGAALLPSGAATAAAERISTTGATES
jgi:hypothetical protein